MYINYNYPGYVNVHVALIYTCNMKENALASCISYARVHRVESGVSAWYCLFTSVGEWVMSSENGTKSKVETHDSCHSRVIRNQQYLYPKFLLLP